MHLLRAEKLCYEKLKRIALDIKTRECCPLERSDALHSAEDSSQEAGSRARMHVVQRAPRLLQDERPFETPLSLKKRG